MWTFDFPVEQRLNTIASYASYAVDTQLATSGVMFPHVKQSIHWDGYLFFFGLAEKYTEKTCTIYGNITTFCLVPGLCHADLAW